jgi:phasin family protein
MEAAMQMHRKNLEVFTKAHKAALATAKEVSQLHGQYTKKMMEDIKNHIQNVRNTSSHDDRVKAHAESIKSGMDRAVNHGRDVMSMWSKTNKEISENFSKRFKEGVDEAKNLVKKKAVNK